MKTHKTQAYTCSLLTAIGLLFQPAIAQTEQPGTSLPRPGQHQTQSAPLSSPQPAPPLTTKSTISKQESRIPPREKSATYATTFVNTTQTDIIINALASTCMDNDGGGPHRIQAQGSIKINIKDNDDGNCQGQTKAMEWSVNDRPDQNLVFVHVPTPPSGKVWFSNFYGSPNTQATCEDKNCWDENSVVVSGDSYMTVTFNEAW